MAKETTDDDDDDDAEIDEGRPAGKAPTASVRPSGCRILPEFTVKSGNMPLYLREERYISHSLPLLLWFSS